MHRILSKPTEYFVTEKLNHKISLQQLVCKIKMRRSRRKLVPYTNKHTHICSKDKTCKATLGLVSLIGSKAVTDSNGFLFLLPIYFLCFPARTSAG